MSLSALLNIPCVIERRTDTGATDRYGSPKSTVVDVVTVCELQPAGASPRNEPGNQGELSVTNWLAIFPPATAIDTSDTVVIDGVVYQVVGDPWQARNPRTQTLSHVEASLRKTGDVEPLS